MSSPNKHLFRTDHPARTDALRASTGLQTAVAAIVRNLAGVRDVLVLHRDDERSKFFFILEESTADRIESIVHVMLQLETAFPGERVDYDTIAEASLALVPDSATSLLKS